ncbi:MAG: glycosyltransferase family 2 protein [Candidatus Daviesbacteria bacterium]|nr:glycosyltransferase family 2 protein [Candidatus Daviesbacteria bacterium]
MKINNKQSFSTSKPSLSVVIPAYNEEESLSYVLNDTLHDLPKIVSDYEIIIVDDGSDDKTPQIADSFAKNNTHTSVIHMKTNSGYNNAMIAGLKAAKKDYVVYMQADGQDLIRDMVNCFKIMDRYDLVLGTRGKRIDYNLYRLILSYGCVILYRVLFDLTYEDVHWVYVWKTKEVQKLTFDPEGGIFILVESLIKLKRKGLKIGEASSPYRPRYGGVNKNTNLGVIWKTLMSIFKLWWKIVTGKI